MHKPDSTLFQVKLEMVLFPAFHPKIFSREDNQNFLGSCGGKHKTSVLYLEVPKGGGGGGGGQADFKGAKAPSHPSLKETLVPSECTTIY